MVNRFLDKRNRVLLFELVKTDFKLRYQGSFLGIIWSVLKPLMLFAVMYTVFVKFLKFTDGTPTYPIVLLLGSTLWGFFTESTNVGMNSIVAKGDLLRKVNFPKYIIILSSMMTALISLGINLCVVLIFAIFSGVKFSWAILLVPFSLMQFFLLSFGIALILSTLYVKFRDISHIYEVLLQVIFYAVPIIYPLSMVSKSHLVISKIMMLNPIAQIIQDIRYGLISQTTSTTWSLINNLWIAIIPVLITVVVLIVGIKYFSKNAKKFAEIL